MKKTMYGLLISALTLTIVFAFAACNKGDKTATTTGDHSEMNTNMGHNSAEMNHNGEMNQGNSSEMMVGSVDFSGQRNERNSALIDAYGRIKNALAANDKSKTAEAAKSMHTALEKFDANELAEGKRKEYAEIDESAKEHCEHIVKSELPHQKEHFESLTTDMKDLLTLIQTEKNNK